MMDAAHDTSRLQRQVTVERARFCCQRSSSRSSPDGELSPDETLVALVGKQSCGACFSPLKRHRTSQFRVRASSIQRLGLSNEFFREKLIGKTNEWVVECQAGMTSAHQRLPREFAPAGRAASAILLAATLGYQLFSGKNDSFEAILPSPSP
jgi:hypothetical protein